MKKENDLNEAYSEEVREKWDNTEQYKEYQTKTKNYSKEKIISLKNEMNLIFKEFSFCKENNIPYNDNEVLDLVKKLQTFITNNFYTCSNEILLQLGKMYVYDERFTKNINQNNIGLANYINDAIAFYCK